MCTTERKSEERREERKFNQRSPRLQSIRKHTLITWREKHQRQLNEKKEKEVRRRKTHIQKKGDNDKKIRNNWSLISIQFRSYFFFRQRANENLVSIVSTHNVKKGCKVSNKRKVRETWRWDRTSSWKKRETKYTRRNESMKRCHRKNTNCFSPSSKVYELAIAINEPSWLNDIDAMLLEYSKSASFFLAFGSHVVTRLSHPPVANVPNLSQEHSCKEKKGNAIEIL